MEHCSSVTMMVPEYSSAFQGLGHLGCQVATDSLLSLWKPDVFCWIIMKAITIATQILILNLKPSIKFHSGTICHLNFGAEL